MSYQVPVQYWVDFDSLYNAPLSLLTASGRIKIHYFGNPDSMNRNELPDIIKLHGSLNWGVVSNNSDTVYYVAEDDEEYKKSHLQTYIIPPVLDKTNSYSNHVIKAIWKRAFEKLSNADNIYIYGFSFANSYNTQNCILIGRVGANCGCITNISDKCWATDNALILKTSSNKNYMNYLLMASNLNDINESNAQPLITASKVLNFKIPFTCNINEQQAIADFLDKKCEKIDKVIGKIEEQIQVLEDYKKSLITETVTKGLDKNVPMKDSGIDWIGNIPKN